MNSLAISNVQELHAEIDQLKTEAKEQSVAIAARFQSPSAIFSTARSLFQKQGPAGNGQGDIFSSIARFLIPLTLNKTLFSRAGFLLKMLVRVVSQKAAGFINESSIEKVITNSKVLFNKLFHSTVSHEQI